MNIHFRLATTDDLHEIYRLSNKKDVRNNSFNSKKITLEEHRNWFNKKINCPNCVYIVGELNNAIISQLRFDLTKKEAIISISVNKNIQGCGIGKKIFQYALDYLKSNKPDINKIIAFVKIENINSVAFFENLGFKKKDDIIIRNQKAFQYYLEL